VKRLFGLRGRLTAALVACGVITLGAATYALLSPLDHRLREDAATNLVTLARDELPELRRALGPTGSPRKVREVLRIIHRLGADEVVLADVSGRARYGADIDDEQRYPEAIAAFRRNGFVRQIGGSGGEDRIHVARPVVGVAHPRLAVVLRKSLTDTRSAYTVVRDALLVAALVGVGVALALGLVLGQRLVRRLAGLRDAALRVADLGPVVEISPDSARDEIGDLTRAFATMQQRLRDQEDARRTFIATASHELRTPIASLRLILEGLADDLSAGGSSGLGEVALADARDKTERAEAQSHRLAGLADELLEVSRIDAGAPLRREPVELGELGRSVIAEMAARAQAAGVELRLEAPQPSWAVADPGSVAVAVRVLIDNAIRYAPRGTAVRVAAGQDERGATVTVSDEGPGVAAEDREHIFGRFVRGSDSTSDGGFGLGLAIAGELAERMGGGLHLAESEHGARFELSLVGAPAP
jgi:signal transduction histidine kinase